MVWIRDAESPVIGFKGSPICTELIALLLCIIARNTKVSAFFYSSNLRICIESVVQGILYVMYMYVHNNSVHLLNSKVIRLCMWVECNIEI